MFVKLINHLSAVLLIVLIMSGNSYCTQAGLNLGHLRQVDQDLLEACRNRNLDQVRIAIDNGANVDVQDHYGETPLMIMIRFPWLESIQLLLDHSANVNIQSINGNTVLIMALLINNKLKIKLLLDHGADIHIRNIYGNSALILARHNPEIEALLKQYDDAGGDSKPSSLLINR